MGDTAISDTYTDLLSTNVFSIDSAYDQFTVNQYLQSNPVTAAKSNTEANLLETRDYNFKLVVQTNMNELFPNRTIDLNASRAQYEGGTANGYIYGTQFAPDSAKLKTALKSQVVEAYYKGTRAPYIGGTIVTSDTLIHQYDENIGGVTYSPNDHYLEFTDAGGTSCNLELPGIFDRLTRCHFAVEYTTAGGKPFTIADRGATTRANELKYLVGSRTISESLTDIAFNTMGATTYTAFEDPYHKIVHQGILDVFNFKNADMWENLKSNYLDYLEQAGIIDDTSNTQVISLDMSNIQLYCHFLFTVLRRNRSDSAWNGDTGFSNSVETILTYDGSTAVTYDVRMVFQETPV